MDLNIPLDVAGEGPPVKTGNSASSLVVPVHRHGPKHTYQLPANTTYGLVVGLALAALPIVVRA